MQSVLSILSRDVSRFQLKQQEKQQLSMRFSQLNSKQEQVNVQKIVEKSTCEVLEIHQNDLSLADAYNSLFEDAKQLASAEFGAEAFSRSRDEWEERKQSIEEFLGLQGSPQLQNQLSQIVNSFLVASQRKDGIEFLINSCMDIFSGSEVGPLLEILKYLDYKTKNEDGNSITYLQKCLLQELKKGAKYSSMGSTVDITTSKLTQGQSIITDASQTGKTLRTSLETSFEGFGQDYSIYGQLYNCVKCGYSLEALDILEKHSQIDQNLAKAVEDLVENDYESGSKLDIINDTIQDPFYYLLTQLFTPWTSDQVVTPSFLDSIFIFTISSRICGKQKLQQIFTNSTIRGFSTSIKAFILLLQENYSEMFSFLYSHGMYLELFVISAFLQDQLVDSVYYPSKLEEVGNDILQDILKKQNSTLSVPLIFTKFINLVNQKSPILLQNNEIDFSKVLLVFTHEKLHSSIIAAQSYIQYLRRTKSQQSPLISYFLSKFYFLSSNFYESIENAFSAASSNLQQPLSILNNSQLFSSLISYYFDAVSQTNFDVSIFQEINSIYAQVITNFEEFQQHQLQFIRDFSLIKFEILTGNHSKACAIFNNIDYNLNLNFAKFQIDQIVKFVNFFIKQGQINLRGEKVTQFVKFAHIGRLDNEIERLVGEISRFE